MQPLTERTAMLSILSLPLSQNICSMSLRSYHILQGFTHGNSALFINELQMFFYVEFIPVELY